jgi:DNA-binding NarL/FixJ family response regulator
MKKLSNSETEILHLLCSGLSTKEVASKSGRSFKTVDNRIQSIYKKIDVKDRWGLFIWALNNGFIQKQDTVEIKETPTIVEPVDENVCV